MASSLWSRSGACRALGALALAAACTPALADQPSVQLGSVTFKPSLLLQLDGGGTTGHAGPSRQDFGFNPRRERVGGTVEIGQDLELSFIWDFGGKPGSYNHLTRARFTYKGFKPFRADLGMFQPGLTLASAASSASRPFLEKPTITSLVTGLVAGTARLGGTVSASTPRFFALTGITGRVISPSSRSEQAAWIGRISGLAVKREHLVLDLGLAGA